MLSEKGYCLSPGQLEAIYNLQDPSKVSLPSARTTVDPKIYTDTARFQLEMDRIFHREPLPLTISGLLPDPGMYVAHEAYGVPLLLTRSKTGEVHAFRNVCRHRGTLLCEERVPRSGGRVVCPYHAWTYGLDGRLIGVPRQETFDKFDKAEFGLRELPCREAGGVIWVALRPGAADFSNATNDIVKDLDAIGLPKMHLYRRKIEPVDANWKLILDAFLENYHVQRLHANSVAKYFVDSANVYDPIGRHLRSTSGRSNFDRNEASPTCHGIRLSLISFGRFDNQPNVCEFHGRRTGGAQSITRRGEYAHVRGAKDAKGFGSLSKIVRPRRTGFLQGGFPRRRVGAKGN